jgi:pimeloyl-ACP methyl ester carboxylesterase
MRSAGELIWTTGTAPGAGIDINFQRTGGDGPVWVLLHGFSDSARCWDRVVAALPADLDVVSLDARNHGASGTGPGGPEVHVADVAAVVRHLGLSSPTLMGHSVGARAAAGVAAAYPELVGRLVLVDPPWRDGPVEDPPPEKRAATRAYIASMASQSVEELQATAEKHHGDWHPDDHLAWIEAKQQLRAASADDLVPADWRAVAAAITCPSLLVHADSARGGIVTPEVAAEVAQNPMVTAVAVAKAGHNLQRENLEGFVAGIKSFLA